MNSKNSFTYVISSDERTNTAANQIFMILTLEDFQEKIKITIVKFFLFQSMEEQQQRQQISVIF